MTYKRRTREEIQTWYRQVRQRKEAWEREAELELKGMIEERRRARESHYFDFVM